MNLLEFDQLLPGSYFGARTLLNVSKAAPSMLSIVSNSSVVEVLVLLPEVLDLLPVQIQD
jgi:hypothetical protein